MPGVSLPFKWLESREGWLVGGEMESLMLVILLQEARSASIEADAYHHVIGYC